MSSNFPTLVEKNQMALSEADQKRILRLYQEKSVTYLAPEKEFGVFLLYSVGDSLEAIALKTNLPKDVILATAIYYNWPEKVKYLQKDGLDPVFIQKELANTLLVATYKSMIEDLGLVIAGKKTAKEVGLIPKNMTALQNLMDMVSKLNTPVVAPASTTTNVIHANQVQVNQIAAKEEPEPWDIKSDDPKRIEMLKTIDS